MLDGMTTPLPLIERKRRQARQRIVEAARELFEERGFDGVSVGDIAERAEVGRTTFFRHFGDKQEVVFAREQELLAAIAAAAEADGVSPPRTTAEAVGQLRPIVGDLCARVAADRPGYVRHFELVGQYPELRDRDAVKMQQFADALSGVLIARGADQAVAVLAGQIAIGCYQTARRLGNDPTTLVAETDAAFAQVLALGAENQNSLCRTVPGFAATGERGARNRSIPGS
jgi:AcrR family transcriptional regulator